MLNLTHPTILDAERFGSCYQTAEYFCYHCGRGICEDADDKVLDNFGRSFCCEICKKTYYKN